MFQLVVTENSLYIFDTGIFKRTLTERRGVEAKNTPATNTHSHFSVGTMFELRISELVFGVHKTRVLYSRVSKKKVRQIRPT